MGNFPLFSDNYFLSMCFLLFLNVFIKVKLISQKYFPLLLYGMCVCVCVCAGFLIIIIIIIIIIVIIKLFDCT